MAFAVFVDDVAATVAQLRSRGVSIEDEQTRSGEPEFPVSPWSLDHIVVDVSDPAASATWLAGVLGLAASEGTQDAVDVALPGCTIAFAGGSANRPTRVVLAGAHAPVGEVAGLRYLRATP